MPIKVMGVLSLRIGFGILAIIATVELLQTQAVLNAILLFGAAGIVPGTDIVLSPEATMWSLAGVLIASILLIFHKDIIVACMPAAPTFEGPFQEQEPEPAQDPPKAFAFVPAVTIEAEGAPRIHRPGVAARLASRFTAGIRRLAQILPAKPTIDFAFYRIQFWKTYAVTLTRLRSFWVELQPALWAILAACRIVARRTWTEGKRAFRLSVTKLAAFDHWATAKIQKQDDLAEIQKWLRTSTKIVLEWLTQVRSFFADFSRKFDR